MNSKQMAVIKKDMRGITSNKQVFSVMLIVPLALTIILPSIFVFVFTLTPQESLSGMQAILDLLPVAKGGGDQTALILSFFLNKIMPIFFLMIPIMASSVMAASSFVGEKEKRTLETLLYSPLTLPQLFRAKILAGFFVSMMVSFISFAGMLIVMEVEVLLFTGAMLLPDLSWIVVMLLIAPAISFVAITITVRGSAKAQTMEEAQQRAIFLILPIILLLVGQFVGVIMLNIWILLGLGIGIALLALLLIKGSKRNFTYEALLR
jgi:ABC-type Na+ efflux pump permease subunit